VLLFRIEVEQDTARHQPRIHPGRPAEVLLLVHCEEKLQRRQRRPWRVRGVRGGLRRNRQGHRHPDPVIGTQRRTGGLHPSVGGHREDPVDRRIGAGPGIDLADHVEVRLEDDGLRLR
jgi:hypothetical protein